MMNGACLGGPRPQGGKTTFGIIGTERQRDKGGAMPTSQNMAWANFHEKAHSVKADVAASLWASATAVRPSPCFHPHC
jgi:hypothetical protein